MAGLGGGEEDVANLDSLKICRKTRMENFQKWPDRFLSSLISIFETNSPSFSREMGGFVRKRESERKKSNLRTNGVCEINDKRDSKRIKIFPQADWHSNANVSYSYALSTNTRANRKKSWFQLVCSIWYELLLHFVWNFLVISDVTHLNSDRKLNSRPVNTKTPAAVPYEIANSSWGGWKGYFSFEWRVDLSLECQYRVDR